MPGMPLLEAERLAGLHYWWALLSIALLVESKEMIKVTHILGIFTVIFLSLPEPTNLDKSSFS